MQTGRDVEVGLRPGRHQVTARASGERQDGAIEAHQKQAPAGRDDQPAVAARPGQVEDPGQVLPGLPAE